jgi:hypothetical protein
MSNYLAIATVTAALQQVLQGPVKNAVNNASVGFSRPDSADGQQTPLVNIFLYQVTPNPSYRNADLPTRRSDGTVLVQRPQAALDLHYLLTFHGNDDQLEPQRMLGAVASTLQSQPLLSTDNITAAVSQFNFLTGSGLESQVERVRFTPTALSLEEFSKLWSVFFQVEYSLSVAYQASLVLIQSDDVPQSALPVQSRNVYVQPLRWPRIDQVTAQGGSELPIVTGTTLVIQGQNLRGDPTLVMIEGQELTPATVSDAQVTLAVPPGVHAGVKGVQILQKLKMGTPEALHRGFESNVAPFVLRPTITAPPTAVAAPPGADVTVKLSPNIGVGQRAVLLLNNPSAVPPAAYTSLPVVSTADTNQVVLHIDGVPTGTYLARVQVDGAESLLTYDTGTNQFTKPTVNMP